MTTLVVSRERLGPFSFFLLPCSTGEQADECAMQLLLHLAPDYEVPDGGTGSPRTRHVGQKRLYP